LPPKNGAVDGILYRDETREVIRIDCFDTAMDRMLFTSDTVGSGVAARTVERSEPTSNLVDLPGETSKPEGIFCNTTFKPIT
jgi:hypothetical protein